MARPKGSLDKDTHTKLDSIAEYMAAAASGVYQDGRRLWISHDPIKDITTLLSTAEQQISHWSIRRYFAMLEASKRAVKVGQGTFALAEQKPETADSGTQSDG